MKKTVLLLTIIFSTIGAFAQNSGACELVVNVDNIKKLKGRMKFAIYNESDDFLKTALKWGDNEINDNSVTFKFEGLSKGIYAVSIFQDENDNGKLDSNFIGIPTEPYAFSNNAKGMFGPPSFKDCQFEIKENQTVITINL